MALCGGWRASARSRLPDSGRDHAVRGADLHCRAVAFHGVFLVMFTVRLWGVQHLMRNEIHWPTAFALRIFRVPVGIACLWWLMSRNTLEFQVTPKGAADLRLRGRTPRILIVMVVLISRGDSCTRPPGWPGWCPGARRPVPRWRSGAWLVLAGVVLVLGTRRIRAANSQHPAATPTGWRCRAGGGRGHQRRAAGHFGRRRRSPLPARHGSRLRGQSRSGCRRPRRSGCRSSAPPGNPTAPRSRPCGRPTTTGPPIVRSRCGSSIRPQGRCPFSRPASRPRRRCGGAEGWRPALPSAHSPSRQRMNPGNTCRPGRPPTSSMARRISGAAPRSSAAVVRRAGRW